MNIPKYDPETGMAYLTINLASGEITTVQETVNVDIDSNGVIVGIEFFDITGYTEGMLTELDEE